MKRIIFLLFVSLFGFQITGNCQIITTIAGGDSAGYSGDGDSLIHARIDAPIGIGFDGSGNMYFSDDYNFRVRKVDTNCIVNSVAGDGTHGFSGDNGPATLAKFGLVFYIAVGIDGTFYLPDPDNNRIRKISPLGIITTIAGNDSFAYTGDGELATNASIGHPGGIALDHFGNLYFTDVYYCVVRKINTIGIISTVAGTGVYGYTGDGGLATAATLHSPVDLSIDRVGNIYVSDLKNNVIRKIDPSGIISTVIGTGVYGYTGDGGQARYAELNYPEGIITDAIGNIFFADEENNCVRKVDTFGIITTIAGNGTLGFSGDGGIAISAELQDPAGLAFDRHGNLYITDYMNNRIRKVTNVTTYTETYDPTADMDINIYPNPVTNSLIVEKANGCQILIRNMIGQMFFSTGTISSTETTINVSEWNNGVYFIEIVNEETGKRVVKKILRTQ